MSSKRKNRNEKKIARAAEQLEKVMAAIARAGGNIKQFFAAAAQAMKAPKWFKPSHEADKFHRVHREGIERHRCYKVPEFIMAWAETWLKPPPTPATA